MKKNWWKWLIVVLALLGSLLATFDFSNGMASKLRFGLDIQGGYSFTLQLDEEALMETLKERNPNATEEELAKLAADTAKNADEIAVEIIRNRIDPLGTEEPVITRGKNDHRIYVQLAGADEAKRKEAERSVKSVAFLEFRLVHAQNDALVAGLFASDKCPDGFKIIESPTGGRYYQHAEDYAEKSAVPGFAQKLSRFEVPDKSYNFMLEIVDGKAAEPRYRPVFVRRRPEMTGENLRRASVGFGQMGSVEVDLTFNAQGAKDFGRVTTKNVGKQLAIILDGTVYSAPVIRGPITGGNAQITGNFSVEEATFLKNILNAGALPAPLKFMGQRFVAPTVGEDALSGAKQAMLWGIGLVIVFMLVYYVQCGLVADIAFILNILLIPVGVVLVSACFSLLDSEIAQSGRSVMGLPVLTLPGIAGMLLTFGMAVDANVLTFERMREEFAAGKPKFVAIMAGYERAFLAILDSNVTTIVTAVILFAFGSGSIRGFAVTLTAGVLVSMFTALVVTKLIFQATVKESSAGKIRMMQIIPSNFSFDFVGKFKSYVIAAVAVVVVTFGIAIGKGAKNPGAIFAVDFTGGAKITYTVTNPETVEGKRTEALEAIRKACGAVGITDAAPQFQSEGDTLLLEIKTVKGDLAQSVYTVDLAKKLTEDVPETVFEWRDVDSVGSQIGREFKKGALLACVFALIGMVIYISIRFKFGFALGAVAALAHDVLVTLGLYMISGRQISLIIVAAILTIVGYSINDTIVIFDRIREEFRNPKSAKLPMKELCNNCICTTLSRTVLTSVTTLLTVGALLVFSKGEIADFAFIMFLGVILGTLSTVFMATPIMIAFYKGKRPDLSEEA